MADGRPQSWTRLRPRRRTIDPGVGLAARTADPLWFLCRQLQFEELTGDDGGAPTALTITANWTPFTHWRPGPPDSDGEWLPFDPHRPLESLVEDDRSAVGGQAPPVLAAAEAGLRLQRALRAALPALAEHPDLPLMGATARPSGLTVNVHTGRTVDGFLARARLDALSAALRHDLSAGDAAALDRLVEEWASWFDRRFGTPSAATSWVQDRLEYQFALSSADPRGGDPLVFVANGYLGAGVDWAELDLAHGVAPPPDAGGPIESVTETRRFPQSLRWPGMPVDRFWEMEDGAIDLGALTLDPADLPGLLALDMATTGSTDWFLTELALPVGGVAAIQSVVVTDTFGDATSITGGGAIADGIGLLFTPEGEQRSGGGLLVTAPGVGARVDGPAREQILLVRDELANLGWIVEQTGPGEDGEPGELRATPREAPGSRADGMLSYRLSTAAPEHWLPLLPRRRDLPGDSRREFARGTVYPETDLELTTTMLARQLDTVLDEEVPREGTRITRSWQYARWYDGSRHLWSGRGIHAGRGEANSSLRFDDTF